MISHQQTPDFAIGRDLTALTVGIDRFQRTQGSNDLLDGEGLVPIYIGEGLVEGAPVRSWDEARTQLAWLSDAVDGLSDNARTRFLRAMVRSVRAAVKLFSGEPISYPEKLTELVAVPAEPVPDSVLTELRERVLEIIGKQGYGSGDPVERIARWQADQTVPSERVADVCEELMTEAKRRTDEMIFDTGEYRMSTRPMRGVHYAARCSFDAGFMDVNLDVPFTRSALKHLVCHEIFPGHSTQLLSTRAAASAGTSPPDALLCTTNGATGAVQEGIGDQGIELIGWVEDENDVAQIELRRLQTAAGTNAAFHLAESGWTTEQSEAYLRQDGFGHVEWARGRTIQAKHPFRGPFLASYWFGNEAVRAKRLSTPASAHRSFIEFLYSTVNTPETVAMWTGS